MLTYETTETVENHLDVLLTGDLDIEGTELIEEELAPFLLEFTNVKLSFAHVPFVDSSGMGLLINLVNKLKENEITVTVTDIKDDVLEVFNLLQLPEILGEEVFV
ncbi:STAS domain-containing protein [Virgibacillus senegalensis]|uniref:STAS domain-containing protein n=1 Tax=Virgibacillus senegalensis TaxID=1499679 RepID=UPI00069E9E55|nr:STAS domain-containing protein [Virgibacillus senegalensis]